MAGGCAVAVLAVSAGPASGSGGDGLGDPLPDVPRSRVTVSLTTVSDQVVAPVAGITAPGNTRDLFVVDQIGLLHVIDVSNPAAWPVGARTVLNVMDLVVGPSRDGDERGFLGAAFLPGDPSTLYTYTSEALDPNNPADFPIPSAVTRCPEPHPNPVPDHRSVIREWSVTGAGTATATVERTPGNGRIVLDFEQPQFNHNGGDLDFGPDGMLYITSGDGGSGDDQDCQIDFDGLPTFGHPGVGNGQNLGTPLGKILRIDPRSATGTPAYTVPAGNPFAMDSNAGTLGEIYAYGFRNPFRASFDTGTPARPAGPDLWTGDVGQNSVEEVDIVVAGGNYGWRLREGAFDFNPAGFDTHGFASDGFVTGGNRKAAGTKNPVAQYDHDDGTAVIGGHVYRGATMPALVGSYVFGDTSRRLNNRHGRLFHVTVTDRTSPRNRVAELLDGPIEGQLIGWGEDARKELYALIMDRDLTGGRVLRLGQASR